MPISDLWNHYVRVWRPAITDGGLGGTTARYQQVGGDTFGPNARVTEFVPPGTRVQGAGEYVIGQRQVSMAAGTDVKEGDVIQVYGGPEAPINLRVHTNPSRPTDITMQEHHVKVLCEPFHGKLRTLEGVEVVA